MNSFAFYHPHPVLPHRPPAIGAAQTWVRLPCSDEGGAGALAGEIRALFARQTDPRLNRSFSSGAPGWLSPLSGCLRLKS